MVIFALLATQGVARDGMRDGDVRFSKGALTDYLFGQVLGFYDNGPGTYRVDGSYDFRYWVRAGVLVE